MSFLTLLALYGLGLATLLVLDGLWLGVVAGPTYKRIMAPVLRPKPTAWAGALFYAGYVVGVEVLVTVPAIDAGSIGDAVWRGAVLGAVAYATFDLTSYAVVDRFPFAIVPIDLVWGTVLTASVAASTYALHAWWW